MRTVRLLPKDKAGPIRRNAIRDERFERFLKTEIEDEISGAAGVMTRYQDYIRMYRGFPSESFSRDPVPIRNIEVTLGATATDTLFSQSWDMIWSAQPIVTVRNAAPNYEEHAEAFQVLVNHLAVDPFTNYVQASKDYMMDDIMLGTGIYYTTWQEDHKKTKVEETIEWGPRVYVPAPEDLVFPTTSGPDIETVRILGFGNELTYGELMARGTAEKWNWEIAAPTRNINSVKRQRMVAEHVTDTDHGLVDKYQIYELFVMFDYDEDGFDEDLYVVWDRFGARILFMSYNPFDIKPFSIARYQYQPHSFLGVGVMEMDSPYEREVSDWHNFRMANARLVGSRAWGVKIGSPMSGTKLRIIPNKPLYFNDPSDIKEFKMADIYPSALQTEQYSSQLARERVGTMTDFQAKPMPGHRTPGVTMMAMLQQINKRFTTAFEEMRAGMAHALMQCVYRMHEKYREGGEVKGRIEDELTKLLGPEKAPKIFDVFRGPTQDLRSKVQIEMTASSQSINREADKQSAMQRLQVLGGYYDKVLQLAIVVANPQTPPAIKDLAVEVAKRSTVAMGQFLRAYESVRNAESLLIDEEAWDALVQQASGQGQPGQLSGMGGGAQAGGSPAVGGNEGGQHGGGGAGAGAPGADTGDGDGGADGLGL